MPPKSKIRQRALTIGLILLGILLTLFFGMRAMHAFRKFNGHRPPPPNEVETDVELIRDWMTISFISQTYRVPEKILFDALEISPQGNHNKSLKQLNQDYYPETENFVLDLVKSTVLAHQPPSIPDSPATAAPPPTAPAAP
jgi:hypothetical protein